jgi:MFS family permease
MNKKKLSGYLFLIVFGPFLMGIIVQELSLCPFEFDHNIFWQWLDGVGALVLFFACAAIIEFIITLFTYRKKKDG